MQSYYHATAHPAPERPAFGESVPSPAPPERPLPVEPWTPAFAGVTGTKTTDILIVGAGITGCSAALHLAQRGYSVAVIEAETVGFGASGRSGGQVIAGYNRDLAEITRLVGREDAHALWDLSQEAMGLTRSLIATHGIDCDETAGQLLVALKPRHLRDLESLHAEWSRLGRDGLELWDHATTRQRIASPAYIGGLYDPHGGHLHPLNYTLGLAAAAENAGAVIYEHTPMLGWEPGDPATVHTPQGPIRARFVILAGNAYLWQRERRLGRRIMPVGTYLLATEPLGAERAEALIAGNAAVSDMNFVLNYFRRSAEDRLLFGGRVSYSRLDPANVAAAMRRSMLKVFPQLGDVAVSHAWGGYVAITVNRLPDFGRLAPNVFYAQGFSGHGLALTGLAGKLMAEAVAGQAERFDVFTRIPHHRFPGGTLLRTPLLVAAMALHRLRDALP